MNDKGVVLAAPTRAWAGPSRSTSQAACAAIWAGSRVVVLNDLAAAGYRYVAAGLRDFAIVTVGSGVGHKVFLRRSAGGRRQRPGRRDRPPAGRFRRRCDSLRLRRLRARRRPGLRSWRGGAGPAAHRSRAVRPEDRGGLPGRRHRRPTAAVAGARAISGGAGRDPSGHRGGADRACRVASPRRWASDWLAEVAEAAAAAGWPIGPVLAGHPAAGLPGRRLRPAGRRLVRVGAPRG